MHHGAPQGLDAFVPRITKGSPRNVTATDEEREKIITAAPPRLRLWLLLCSDLALRSGTAAKIAPINYDAERGEISYRTKFNTAQTLPVTAAIAALFASAKGNPSTPYVQQLPQRANCKATPCTLRQEFARLRKRLGIEKRITPHDLRRTTAVRTLEVTGDLRIVQALLGHKELSTTLWYLDHRTTRVDRAVLEAAKLNERKK